jgi:hypothetical protein
MNKPTFFLSKGVALVLGTLLVSVPTFGEDLSGVWGFVRGQYGQENAGGSDLADYTGIPINAEGRAVGLSYSASMLSEPLRQCQYYSPRYEATGPIPLVIWSDNDPVTGRVVAWNIGAYIDKDIVTIWMDGRPHPSENAFHSSGGFATGSWKGDTLVIRTTHMKWSILRLNGLQHSDRATMTQYITRHGDLLSMLTYFEDPVYLTEPYVLSSVWQRSPTSEGVKNPLGKADSTRVSPACEPIDESPRMEKDGSIVPHYLAGKNPSADEYAKFYNLPLEVAQGGAETIYPEIRKKLKDIYHYQPPEKCIRYCCDTTDPAVKCIRDGTGRVE